MRYVVAQADGLAVQVTFMDRRPSRHWCTAVTPVGGWRVSPWKEFAALEALDWKAASLVWTTMSMVIKGTATRNARSHAVRRTSSPSAYGAPPPDSVRRATLAGYGT